MTYTTQQQTNQSYGAKCSWGCIQNVEMVED